MSTQNTDSTNPEKSETACRFCGAIRPSTYVLAYHEMFCIDGVRGRGEGGSVVTSTEREALSEFLFTVYEHGSQPNALREADAILTFLRSRRPVQGDYEAGYEEGFQHGRSTPRENVQAKPTPIQVRVAAKAINIAGWTAEGGEHEPGCFCEDCERVCTPVARAALRAASAAGENREGQDHG